MFSIEFVVLFDLFETGEESESNFFGLDGLKSLIALVFYVSGACVVEGALS